MNAFEELQARAERGDAQAQLELGTRLRSTTPEAPMNPELAVSWIRKAAEQGLVEAKGSSGFDSPAVEGGPRGNG